MGFAVACFSFARSLRTMGTGGLGWAGRWKDEVYLRVNGNVTVTDGLMDVLSPTYFLSAGVLKRQDTLLLAS